MHKSLQMTVLLPTPLIQRGIIFMFPFSIAITTDEVDHPWCISSYCDFLGVLRSNFAIFQSMRRSPTHDQRGVITTIYLVNIYIDILGVIYKSIYLLLF